MRILDVLFEDLGVRGVWMLYAPEIMKKLNNMFPAMADNAYEEDYKDRWMSIINKTDPTPTHQFAKWITQQFLNFDLTLNNLNTIKVNLKKYLELVSVGKLERKHNISYLNYQQLEELVNSSFPNETKSHYYEDKDVIVTPIENYNQFQKVKSPYWEIDETQFQNNGKFFLITLKNNRDKFLFNFEKSIFRDRENNFIGKDHLKLLVDKIPGLLTAFGNRLNRLLDLPNT